MKCILSDTQRSEREIPHWIKHCSRSRDINLARNPPKFLAQRTLARKFPLRAGYFCRLCRQPRNRFLASLGLHTLRPGKTLPLPFGKTQAQRRAGHFGLQTGEYQARLEEIHRNMVKISINTAELSTFEHKFFRLTILRNQV